MIRVESVQPELLGSALGLAPGYELLSIDGRELEDFLDWEFLTAEEEFVLLARTPDGELVEFDVERPEGLPMGVELEPPRIRRCANRCDFCFVDGLPEGLRETLYVRDDDYRLSFRYGNFATLTNLKPKDIERIIEYRLSPLYVSVHATDPLIRRRVLRNPRAPDIVQLLTLFAEHGIRFHTQIVLQPGLNDGDVLEESIRDLYAMGDPIVSVSTVPVGLTEFSKHHLVREPGTEECRAVAGRVDAWAERALAERGCHWIYGSDDLYLVAGLPLPPPGRYDEFEQVENGVGAVRFLQQQIGAHEDDLADWRGRRVGVLTGTAMERLMPEVLPVLRQATGADLELFVLPNRLFGTSVTSAGLLPGSSFREALAGRPDLDLALLPAEAVNDRGVFLDDVAFSDLQLSVPMELRLSYHFADALAEGAGV